MELRSPFFKLGASAALLLPHAIVAAQDSRIADLLSGGRFPATMKVKELPEGYQAVRLKVGGSTGPESFLGAIMPAIVSGMMGDGSDPRGRAAVELFGMMDIVWTSGEEISMAEGTYLVTYRLDTDLAAVERLSKPGGAATPLRLDLVRTSAITSISPRPDITRESWLKAITPPGPATGAGSPQERTVANAKQLATGMIMYMTDCDDMMPYVNDTKSAFYVVQPYVKSREVFKTYNPKGGSFRLNMAVSGVLAAAVPDPAKTPLLYDSKAWPDGTRVVAFMDTRVLVVSEEEWQRLQPYLRLKIKRHGPPLPSSYGREFDKGAGGNLPGGSG